MGDRTYCTITINKHYYNQLEQEFGGEDKFVEETYIQGVNKDKDSETVECYDDQANYGSMEKLESTLQEKEIEYDKRWEAGGDYGAGEEFARKVNGVYMTHDISDEGVEVLQHHKNIKEILDQGGTLEDVRKHVEDHITLLEPFEVTPLTMPQSIDFIKNA